jgi:hypothetical protein
MLKLSDFLFIRKLLVLGILMGGLIFALSTDQKSASATPCCSICDDPFMECVAYCQTTSSNPGKVWICVQEECQPAHYSCIHNLGDCDPGC